MNAVVNTEVNVVVSQINAINACNILAIVNNVAYGKRKVTANPPKSVDS